MNSYNNRQRWLEITAVLATGFLKFIFMDWLDLKAIFIFSAVIIWAIYIIHKTCQDKALFVYWGFTARYLKESGLAVGSWQL